MPFDKKKAKENLQEVLEKMQNNTDAVQLHEYYKLFKKEISFFRRSLAAAWLFMYYDGKEQPKNKKTVSDKKHQFRQENSDISAGISSGISASVEKTERDFEADDKNTEKSNFISIPEEEAKRLFLSIGKNRRLFPKEIISLIMTKTSAAREDIGIIRILENYSFVQVKDTKADEIIAALSGQKFRGRTLVVNYAKSKNNESETEGNINEES